MEAELEAAEAASVAQQRLLRSNSGSDFCQTLESCTEKAQFGRQLRLQEFLGYLRLMGVIQCQTVVRHFSQLVEKVKLSRQL